MILNILAILILVIIIPLMIGIPNTMHPNPRNYDPNSGIFDYWKDGIGIIITLTSLGLMLGGLIWCFVRVIRMLQ